MAQRPYRSGREAAQRDAEGAKCVGIRSTRRALADGGALCSACLRRTGARRRAGRATTARDHASRRPGAARGGARTPLRRAGRRQDARRGASHRLQIWTFWFRAPDAKRGALMDQAMERRSAYDYDGAIDHPRPARRAYARLGRGVEPARHDPLPQGGLRGLTRRHRAGARAGTEALRGAPGQALILLHSGASRRRSRC